MISSTKRLLCLNLVIILILALFPMGTVTAASDTRDVTLTDPSGQSRTFSIGAIHLGRTDRIDLDEWENPSVPVTGDGWYFSDGVLTLTSGFGDNYIVAQGDLILAFEGDVSFSGGLYSAIQAEGDIYFMANGCGNSVNIKSEGSYPAVVADGNCYAEYPLNMTISGYGGKKAMEANTFYFSLSPTEFAQNEIQVGYNTASNCDLETYRPYLCPTGSTLTLTAEDPMVTLTVNYNGGTDSNGAASKVYSKPLSQWKVLAEDNIQYPDEVLPALAKSGYVFLGYSRNQHGITDIYQDAGAYPWVVGLEDELTAIWQKMPAGGEYIILHGDGRAIENNSEYDGFARYAIPLVNGKAVLPDSTFARYEKIFLGWSETPVDGRLNLKQAGMVEDLMFPGEEVTVSSGTTLYAVYANTDSAVIDGNGGVTAKGNDRVAVSYHFEANASNANLLTYHYEAQQAGWFSNGDKAIIDFNTEADGSGTYMPYAKGQTFAQWAEAPQGSILLYSNDYATVDGRYGKVILPAAVASFDLASANGFTWVGHYFTGWAVPRSNSPVPQLPSADANGHIILHSLWSPYKVSYVVDAEHTSFSKSAADENGKVTISNMPYFCSDGKTFNGWNTKQDGTGDWYLPGKTIQLNSDLTLYEQTVKLEDGENAVLIEDLSGTKHWEKFIGTAGGDKVTVTLPTTSPYWVGNVGWQEYGFEGGKTYDLPKGMTLKASDGSLGSSTFYGNGGLFAYGSVFRNGAGNVSFSDLKTYPGLSDFTSIPTGGILKGWSTEANPSTLGKLYTPGERLGYSAPAKLYAYWEDANTAYVTFTDPDQGTSASATRYTAGETIQLPFMRKLGYELTGWNDGTTTYLPGSTYTVPAGETTLTAVWKDQEKLVVNGVEYDPAGTYDHSNGETQGWKYENKNLYLYNYSGGPIIMVSGGNLYLYGTNTITAPAGKPALTCNGNLYVQDNRGGGSNFDDIGSLTLTGGSGAPAVFAQSLTLRDLGPYHFTGGAREPAVLLGASNLGLHGGHVILQGGAGAPAYKSSYSTSWISTSSQCEYYAGADLSSLTKMTGNEFKGENYLCTKPVYVTLTVDGNGGKVNGRSKITFRVEAGSYFHASELSPYHPGGTFLHWDREGSTLYWDATFSVGRDITLVAQWSEAPYDRYIMLNGEDRCTINGEDIAYIKLPTSGTITLPEPVMTINSSFDCWRLLDENNYDIAAIPANTPIPVEWLENGTELVPAWNNDSTILYLHPNGTRFTDTSDFMIQRWTRNGQNSITLDRWLGRDNTDGWVVDSWNTKADGTGTKYTVGSTVTVPSGGNTVLYAQWKPVLKYVTKKANDRLPYYNDYYESGKRYSDYGRFNGQYMASLMGWQTEDGKNFYYTGATVNLPAGTTLYAVYGDFNEDATIILHGNGADHPTEYIFSQTWTANDPSVDPSVHTVTEITKFTREGYRFTGWNTKADGSGTSYAPGVRFKVGESDANGNNWTWDDALLAKLPHDLYAQWEKLPEAEVPIPTDMMEKANADIMVAIYRANGAMDRIVTVPDGSDVVKLFDLKDGMTYQILCVSNDGAMKPLTPSEEGKL